MKAKIDYSGKLVIRPGSSMERLALKKWIEENRDNMRLKLDRVEVCVKVVGEDKTGG